MKPKNIFFIFFLLSLIFLPSGISLATAGIYWPSDPVPPSSPEDDSIIPPPLGEVDGGSTEFPDITEFIGDLNSGLGNFASLKDDYFSVVMGPTGDPNVRREIGGVAIVDFVKEGIVGYSTEGNPLYKYRMRCEFYILVYTTYSVSDFYSLATTSERIKWLEVDQAGAITWGDVYETFRYYISYDEYSVNYNTVESAPNGGAYDLPITVEFNVPNSGATLTVGETDYHIIDVVTQVASLTTSEEPAEVSTIGSTDAKWSSGAQSGTVTVHTNADFNAVSTDTDMDSVEDDMTTVLNSHNPGWKSEGTKIKITDSIHNIVAMGTNSRIASGGSTHSLSGTYQVNIGANVYHYKSEIRVKYAKLRADIRGPWTGVAVEMTSDRTVNRIVGFGIDNYYTKQKLRCEIDVYTELEELEADITPDIWTDPLLPNITEEIDFDDTITGDENVTLYIPKDTSTELKWILIGVGAITIVVIVIVVVVKAKLLGFGGRQNITIRVKK